MIVVVDVAAAFAIIAIIGSYLFVATGYRSPPLFHLANAVGAVPLGLSAALHEAWPSLTITVCFGVIGVIGFAREMYER